jgi:hypothetical protein
MARHRHAGAADVEPAHYTDPAANTLQSATQDLAEHTANASVGSSPNNLD